MGHLIEDFIENTNAATSREEIFLHYQHAVRTFGYESAVYTFITDHLSINQKAGHGVKCNFPEDWMAHYWEKGYEKIDPITKHAFQTQSPFTWDYLVNSRSLAKKQLLILGEAKDAGLKSGVGVPLYGPKGEIAGVGLASSLAGINPDKNTISRLKLLSEQFHLAYCSLGQTEKSRSKAEPRLTDREIEILKWWAAGKTAEEIGMILNCSTATVKWHIQNTYKKLNTNSKGLAIFKSIWLGFIPLDMVKLDETG